MSYWTKRRKVDKNVKIHIAEIEQENENAEKELLANEQNFVNLTENYDQMSDDASPLLESDESKSLNNSPEYAKSNLSSDDDDENFYNVICGGSKTSYYLISDSESEGEIEPDESSVEVEEKIANWAVESDTPMIHLGSLLSIIQPFIPNLPKDPRTLLKTKLSYDIDTICGGKYYHFGLASGIKHIISELQDVINETCLYIQLSMDGLPLFKSSPGQFWPILGRLEGVGNCDPFIIGLYYGNSKPSDVGQYLHKLIEEIKELKANGILLLEQNFEISISSVICDTPARAFIKNTKLFSGYHGCDKCLQTGTWNKKMTYPELDSPLRTDSDFLNRRDEEHHKGPSPFEEIVGMVSCFPVDYMHLVCLGVVKRLITAWLKGDLKVRISGSQGNHISNLLCGLRHYIPSEFARRPRGFSEVERWKATEFRQFLLYTGPVVLLDNINDIIYKNFMLLSVSLHILLNSTLVEHYSDYAEKLLATFVQHYGELYGKENIVYNVHGLLHLSKDASKFGSLDKISSFPFENYLMKVKKMVRKPTFPLQQVIRRLSEKKPIKYYQSTCEPKYQHYLGPLPDSFDVCNCLQYKSVKIQSFVLNLNNRDQYVRIDGYICKLENIVSKCDETFVVFRRFVSMRKFFETPLDSDLLGIYKVKNLGQRLYVKPLQEVQTKYIVMPYREEFVAMPFTDSIWDLRDYLVVEFKEEDEVAVIPKKWLYMGSKEKCLWPPWKSVGKIEKAVRNKEPPDNTFIIYEISRIMYHSDSFSKASFKAKQAEVTSDLQTEAEEVIDQGKRSRRPPERYDSDSSPEKKRKRPRCVVRTPESSPSTTPTKTPIKRRPVKVLPPLPDFPLPPVRPESASTPTTRLNTPRQETPGPSRINNPVSTPITRLNTPLQETPGPSRINNTVSAVDRKVLTLLEDNKAQNSQIIKMLGVVLKKLDQSEQNSDALLPDGILLPMLSMADYQSLEEKLENEEIMKKMTNHLGTIGGETTQDCTRRLLRYTISNQLALNFNWKGQGDKTAIGNSRLVDLIRKSVRRNRLTASATDHDVNNIIKDWLRYAKDRDGGRKRRILEKERKAAAENNQNK